MHNTRYRVLLIENDEVDQMAFKRLVKEKNLPYDCTIAGSVSEANAILAADEFDVIIVDYLLGDGTAFDVFNSIIGTPTIFATGVGDEELAVKALKAGASDYLIKDTAHNYLKVLPETIKNAIERKRTEDELQRYHDNLESLVEERTEQLAAEKEILSVTLSSMSDGVITVDAEKRIMLFNKIAEELTEWKFEEVQGKAVDEIFQLIDEKTKSTIENPVDKVLSSGKTEAGSKRDALIARGGSERPIFATASSIRKNDGTMIGIVMVFRDVSQEREIERMKEDIVSLVSHELRTPLTSIHAYTETILCDPNMPEKTRRGFLSIIDEESNRLANLIEDILEVSRIESRSVEVVREAVDVAAIIRQVLLALQPLAEKKDIQLKADIADELGELQADKSKIQSMVTNLVNNAIKFTPERGRVSVSAQRRSEELVIRISDTGIGIPKEALARIFERFYRVYRPGAQIQGTGLGLAIVEKIVEMHSGRIEVESEVDEGTTFTISLPLTARPALEAEQAETVTTDL